MSQWKFCVWCNQALDRDLKWQQIFRFQPLSFDCLCTACRSLFIVYQRANVFCQTCGRAVELSQEPWENVASHETNFNYGFLVTETLLGSSSQKVLCMDCVRWFQNYPLELLHHDAVLEYSEAFREWLYRYKYRGDYRLRHIAAEPLKRVYQQYQDYQWLVLPSSPNSLRERQFHATAGLLEAAGIPYLNPLSYIGDGRKQAQKTRLERLSLSQPFDITNENFAKISKNILIFDDVYTTGATLVAAKHILFKKNKELDTTGDKLRLISLSLARDSQNSAK